MQQLRSPEDLHWLLLCSAECLGRRDFAGCRKYANQCQEFYPEVPGAGQILTIADILEASRIRLQNNNLNWYDVLQISVTDSKNPQLVRVQFKRLVLKVGFYKRLFPFGQEAFDLVCDAFSVLRNEDKRTQYEIDIGISEPELPQEEPSNASMVIVLDDEVESIKAIDDIGIEPELPKEEPPKETNTDQPKEATMEKGKGIEEEAGGSYLGVDDDSGVVQIDEEDDIFAGLEDLVDLPRLPPW